jgi:hypothetical protein
MKTPLLLTLSAMFFTGCLVVSHTPLDSTAARTVYFLSTWFAYPAIAIGLAGGGILWMMDLYEKSRRVLTALLLALGVVGLVCYVLGNILIKDIA